MRALLATIAALFLATAGVTAGAAHADDVVSYALVVGSNRPGPGQTALAFAEDDAREVADVLRDLGGYDRARVQVVTNPSAATLLAAIATLERAVAADVAAGRTARVFFYYSGHARASGLSLGADELALDTLRARLFATRAALTVVVLDACQSGAFSRVKGAEPAADFSYNSRARLDASGVAVLASSTGSELSQESDYLRSSYFTHNLLVGLRGAADDNHDGRVSLDEAYRYTYHQTLLATAATAVGTQHVSVEVDLKGAGEIPLSFPERASATLTLPAAGAGQVLVVKMPARAVVAELQKRAGAAVQVAVAPGRYQVLFRTDARILRCPVTAGPGAAPLALDGCAVEAPTVGASKGGGGPAGPRWLAATTFGLGASRADGYTQRLEDFGYHKQLGVGARLGVDVLRRVHPHVLVGGSAALVGGDEWRRDTDLEPLTIQWNTATVGPLGRVELRTGPVAGFAQLGAGLAITGATFRDQQGQAADELHAGPYAGAALGVEWMPWATVGFTGRVEGSYAPSLPNLLGDRHDTGLLGLALGVVVTR
ncbi:MAG: caspase family protein [Myxococcales bacterium]|nr:caspase family protein [Myxococcales bacterium]